MCCTVCFTLKEFSFGNATAKLQRWERGGKIHKNKYLLIMNSPASLNKNAIALFSCSNIYIFEVVKSVSGNPTTSMFQVLERAVQQESCSLTFSHCFVSNI